MRQLILAVLFLFPLSGFSSINITDNTADIVSLRKNCTAESNCATTFDELLTWVWTIRAPTAESPLLINIGPGTFPIEKLSGAPMFLCNGGGNVVFKGSGQDRTALTTGDNGGVIMANLIPFVSTDATVRINNCDNLTFQDMTIEPGGIIGVGWTGGGNSVWSNVHVQAGYWAWIDLCSSTGLVGKHKWFGSSLESASGGAINSVYRSDCATNIFHGSELVTVRNPGDNALLSEFVVVQANSMNANIQLYGSSVKGLYPSTATGGGYRTSDIVGLEAKDGGMIHMHGGIVSVRSERPGTTFNAIGARASNGGMVHVVDTAYGMLASGTGIAKRLVNSGGMVDSPFQWPASATPPTAGGAGNLQSVQGADSFVETDCNTAGTCTGVATSDQQPHLMVYSANCAVNGPWFDMATNMCRQ